MTREIRHLLFWNAARGNLALPDQLVQAGWQVTATERLEDARGRLVSQHYCVGLAYLNPLDTCLLHAFEQLLLESRATTEWLALVEPDYADSMPLCRLLAGGVFDFHTLPLDPVRLIDSLGHAAGLVSLRSRCHGGEVREGDSAAGMVARSPGMRQLFRCLDKVARTEAPVLITGESGSGKELTARAIHARSQRPHGPLVTVNCASLPPNLIQTELFGHEKGAFTGAVGRKLGRIESAAGGTVFLDEIGDLPLEQQTSLLRFLQEGTIDRVGGNRSLPVDVRVMAATHQDLEAAVGEGRFREDLYYRLNVLRVHVPPLRERIEDIESLAWQQFERFARERGVQVRGFSEQALMCLLRHDWPGNVRELVNRIRRAIVMAEGRLITPRDLGLDRRSGQRRLPSLQEVRAEADSRAIRASLRLARNNCSQAARSLGISRVTLYRLMDKHGIPNDGDAAPVAAADTRRGQRVNGEASLKQESRSWPPGHG